MITPAISVMRAIEGLGIFTPTFDPYIIPVTIFILACLFMPQHRGTEKIGSLFGPVILLWFSILAVLGLMAIVANPRVLTAVWPGFGIRFLLHNHIAGFLVLGAVFLVVTSVEALYADMGHFGAGPIRLVWGLIVLPALLLNYFGQGAYLIIDPGFASHPFYSLVPAWGTIPMVVLALMVTTIGLVEGFRSSSSLAAAYGVAVTSTMVISTILFYVVAREKWKWRRLAAGIPAGFFLLADLSFFGANVSKILHGAWFPLVIGAIVFTLMITCKK